MPVKTKEYFIPSLVMRGLTTKPTRLARKRVRAELAAAGFDSKTARLELRGSLLSGTEKALDAFAKANGLTACGVVIIKDTPYPVLTRPPLPKDVILLPKSNELYQTVPEVFIEVESALRLVAAVSGYRFRLLFSEGPSVPPFVREPGVINVVIGAAPPGAVEFIFTEKLFGVKLDQSGMAARRYGGVRGYGTILLDENETEISQVVDTTLYLLLPVGCATHVRLMSHAKGPGLFYRAFAKTWNEYHGTLAEPKSSAIASKADFLKHMQVRSSLVRELGANALKDANLVVEKQRQKLFEKLESRNIVIQTNRGFDAFIEDIEAQAAKEWDALRRHPLISSIREVNDGLQIETVPIIAEHEGERYRLGRYAVRYALGTRVSVWAVEPYHPKRIAHPHISPEGVICYGNVEQAIAEAATSIRPSEVIQIVLSWLADGYDPRLADTKITEWPKEKRRGKLLASEKTL